MVRSDKLGMNLVRDQILYLFIQRTYSHWNERAYNILTILSINNQFLNLTSFSSRNRFDSSDDQ